MTCTDKIHLGSCIRSHDPAEVHGEMRMCECLQGATRALENVPEAVEGLQATVDAALPQRSYAIILEVARSMHAGVCELLLQRRLPLLPAEHWQPLADACVAWERSVRCDCVTASPPAQLVGGIAPATSACNLHPNSHAGQQLSTRRTAALDAPWWRCFTPHARKAIMCGGAVSCMPA